MAIRRIREEDIITHAVAEVGEGVVEAEEVGVAMRG
jgi:hypothetical protein